MNLSRGASHFICNPPATSARRPRLSLRHATGAANDLFFLIVTQVSEPGPAINLGLMLGNKPGDAGLGEADLGSAGDQEPPGNQPLARIG